MTLTELGLQEVYLDLQSRFIGSFFAKEGERNARGLLVNLIDNGQPVSLTGYTFKLFVRTREKKVYETSGSIVEASKGQFKVIYTHNMLKSGKAQAELRIYSGSNNIASRTFTIDIGQAILSEDLIQGSDEMGLMEQLRKAAESENQRLANERARKDAETTRERNEDDRAANDLLREERINTIEDKVLFQDLDRNKKGFAVLEVKNGKPRLRVEEIR